MGQRHMPLQQIIRVLQDKVPVFQKLTMAQCVQLLEKCVTRNYKEGDVVCQEDEEGSEMYVLLSGALRVMKNGKQIATIADSSVVGEMAIFTRHPRSATLIAESAVSLFVITKTNIEGLKASDPHLLIELLYSVVAALAEKLLAADIQLSESG